MLAMPFGDNTFDLIVSSLAIHNMDERDLRNHTRRLQAVSDAARVLKSGGRLLITDLLWTRRWAQHARQLRMDESTTAHWFAPLVRAFPRRRPGDGHQNHPPDEQRSRRRSEPGSLNVSAPSVLDGGQPLHQAPPFGRAAARCAFTSTAASWSRRTEAADTCFLTPQSRPSS
jgi:SAM-dependent methyltransferase